MFRFHRKKLCQAAGLSLCLGAPFVASQATAAGDPTQPPPSASASTVTGATSTKTASTPPTHEELLLMAPQEREARLKSLRDRKVLTARGALTPAEREQRRLEIRQRLEKRLDALRKRKKEGSLNSEEEKQLRRLEEVYRRFQTPKKGKPEVAPPPPPIPPLTPPLDKK